MNVYASNTARRLRPSVVRSPRGSSVDTKALKPRRLRVGLAVALVVALGIVGVTALFAVGPGAEQRAARAAGAALVARVSALSEGEMIDFATAVRSPWQRALVFDAYVPGDQMNEALGFEWFEADDASSFYDGEMRLLFVSERTVVADVRTRDGTFWLDFSGTGFAPSDAVFVASRVAGGPVTLARP